MLGISIGRCALSLCVALLLAGCGGSQPPISAPGALPQSRTVVTHADRSGSWMLPEAKSEDLLYVTELGTYAGHVFVYSYPQGKFLGQIAGFEQPEGECADKKGDVFITDQFARDIVEYAHGGTTPIAVLGDRGSPHGCSFDSTTGDLAVANLSGPNTSEAGDIAIYRNARGVPHEYSDRKITYYFYCGYDDKGDLFVDGDVEGSFDQFGLAELRKGGKTLKNVTLNKSIEHPGGVQWDGKHLAIGDWGSQIYQFTISGSSGTEVGTTELARASQVAQFWIYANKVVGPDASEDYVGVWNYPTGGVPSKIVRRHDRRLEPFGAVVSVAPH